MPSKSEQTRKVKVKEMGNKISDERAFAAAAHVSGLGLRRRRLFCYCNFSGSCSSHKRPSDVAQIGTITVILDPSLTSLFLLSRELGSVAVCY